MRAVRNTASAATRTIAPRRPSPSRLLLIMNSNTDCIYSSLIEMPDWLVLRWWRRRTRVRTVATPLSFALVRRGAEAPPEITSPRARPAMLYRAAGSPIGRPVFALGAGVGLIRSSRCWRPCDGVAEAQCPAAEELLSTRASEPSLQLEAVKLKGVEMTR